MTAMTKQELRTFPVWDDPDQCRYFRVEIDEERCDGCKLCTLVCPVAALEIYGEKGNLKARVKESNRGCISCNNCFAICDNQGIRATQSVDFTGRYKTLGRGGFELPRNF